jgi:exonuclease SbcC
MTDSRYLLVRKVVSNKVSDKLGLELEVMDNYTGKRRDITSLSGGESFKASLSLALGMSDVIQSYSGGIVVEAMFIDEGFGSLDSDSLEQAMNAIMMLSNNDCLIGIISHVSELKDRIDKKIIVSKSNNGSSVSVVV